MKECPPRAHSSEMPLPWSVSPEDLNLYFQLGLISGTALILFSLLLHRYFSKVYQANENEQDIKPVFIIFNISNSRTKKTQIESSVRKLPGGKNILGKRAIQTLKTQIAPIILESEELPPIPKLPSYTEAIKTLSKKSSQNTTEIQNRRLNEQKTSSSSATYKFKKLIIKQSFIQDLANSTKTSINDLLSFVSKNQTVFFDGHSKDPAKIGKRITSAWHAELIRRVNNSKSVGNSSNFEESESVFVRLENIPSEDSKFFLDTLSNLKKNCLQLSSLLHQLNMENVDSALKTNQEIIDLRTELLHYKNGWFSSQVNEIFSVERTVSCVKEEVNSEIFLEKVKNTTSSLSNLKDMSFHENEKGEIVVELPKGSVALSSLFIPVKRLNAFRNFA